MTLRLSVRDENWPLSKSFRITGRVWDSFPAIVVELFDGGTAAAFRELLSRSGGEDPAVLFRRFRGRDVELGPLPRRLGFSDALEGARASDAPRRTPGSPLK